MPLLNLVVGFLQTNENRKDLVIIGGSITDKGLEIRQGHDCGSGFPEVILVRTKDEVELNIPNSLPIYDFFKNIAQYSGE